MPSIKRRKTSPWCAPRDSVPESRGLEVRFRASRRCALTCCSLLFSIHRVLPHLGSAPELRGATRGEAVGVQPDEVSTTVLTSGLRGGGGRWLDDRTDEGGSRTSPSETCAASTCAFAVCELLAVIVASRALRWSPGGQPTRGARHLLWRFARSRRRSAVRPARRGARLRR